MSIAQLGNVKDDFGVNFQEEPGSEASIDFTSEGAKVIKGGADAGVNVQPGGEVKAKVQIEFTKEKSFLVKSPTITVKNIKNVNELAKQLKGKGSWDGKWKVVHQVYNALDAVIVSTIDAGTKVDFSGDATALGQMKLGSAGVNIDTNKALGLKINGKNGVIGLGLFRIKSKIFGGLKVEILGEKAGEDGEEAILLKPDEVKDDL